MNKKISLPLSIALVVVIGAICFFAGYKINSKSVGLFDPSKMTGRGVLMDGKMNEKGGSRSGGFINGEIIKKDDSSITVELNNGGSKIVKILDSTVISKSVDGVKDDLEIGKIVMVSGSSDDSGLTAQSIQIRSDEDLIKDRNDNFQDK